MRRRANMGEDGVAALAADENVSQAVIGDRPDEGDNLVVRSMIHPISFLGRGSLSDKAALACLGVGASASLCDVR